MKKVNLIAIKVFHWEFWPITMVYFPLFLYYLWLSLKARSFTFFTAANPGIENGGLFHFSKYELLRQLDQQLVPGTLFFAAGAGFEQVKQKLSRHHFSYPLIIKPDKLERGVGVILLQHEEELKRYLSETSFEFIIQEYIDFPFEAGVFFVRHPAENSGEIKSIVLKKFLSVTGNGQSCVAQLMKENPRAVMQLDRLREVEILDYVPSENEEVIVEPIGNHNRGTTFLDGNYLINDRLQMHFNAIASQIDGFYYGRIDLKAPSLQDFLAGKNLKILEVNGVNSEPAHIYQPGFSLWQAWKILIHHWHLIYKISLANQSKASSTSLKDLIQAYRTRKGSIETISSS